MKIKFITSIIAVLLIVVVLRGHGQNITINGYVIVEDLFIPVEDQVVKIKDQNGVLLASAITDELGFYEKIVKVQASTRSINVAFDRICSGEVFSYDFEMPVEGAYLSHTFMVCDDKECKARFNYNRDSGSNLVFEFIDVSGGDITSWNWDFGDGNSSNLQNPVHVYLIEGDYDVTLSVAGKNCNDQVQRVVHAFNHACLAKFEYEQIIVGQDLVVNFINQSEGQIINYFWKFDDGIYSTVENPQHTYESPGEYHVILYIDAWNCSNYLQKTIIVNPLPACFSLFVCEQEFADDFPIRFTDLSEAKSILSREWDFGDNNTSSVPNPLHVYSDPGEYQVSLTIHSETDNSTYTRTVQVIQSEDFQADFEYSQPNPNIPKIDFTSQTSNEMLQFYWVFGDGNTSNEKSPSHLYDDFGTYIASLYVIGYGGSDNSSDTILVLEPVYCNAIFYTEQLTPQTKTVSFFNESFGTDFTSFWDFGDGTSSTEQNPVHTYNSHGLFEAKLIISTSDNCVDSTKRNVRIYPPLNISGQVYVGDNVLNIGSVFLYKKSGNDVVELYGYQSLGDGTFTFSDLSPGNYFVQAIPQFNFPFPTIPSYFPVYSGNVVSWQDAQVVQIETASQTIDLNLGSYNDFFDGKATLAGEVLPTDPLNETPTIIYLSDESDQVFQFRMLDAEQQFEFAKIPYGDYKLFPEKAGKLGEPLTVSLDEDYREMTDIKFLETTTTIIPDVSAILQLAEQKIYVYPNPANQQIRISNEGIENGNEPISVKIFNASTMKLLLYADIDLNQAISIAKFPNGIYIVQLTHHTKTLHQKLLIRH